jgi:hypothetical protein
VAARMIADHLLAHLAHKIRMLNPKHEAGNLKLSVDILPLALRSAGSDEELSVWAQHVILSFLVVCMSDHICRD